MGSLAIIDAEYTTWIGAMERGWAGKNEYRELVQFAYVEVDTERLGDKDYYFSLRTVSWLVKPSINPRLSEYFEELTGITNDMVVSTGIDLEEARERIEASMEGKIWCSWGPDLDVINSDLSRKGLDYLSITSYLDYRELLRAADIDTSLATSGSFLEQLDSPEIIELLLNHPQFAGGVEYRAHNAIHDVMSLACGLLANPVCSSIQATLPALISAKQYR